MTEYLPNTFKGVYFSVSHGILHSSLIDFKWREQLLLNIDDNMDENGIYVETIKELTVRELEDLMYKYSYTAPTLKQFMLSKAQDFFEVKYDTTTIEHIFDAFISPLIQNWENLKRTYEKLIMEEHESIFESKKSLSKVESQCPDLEFCGRRNWKSFTDEETKDFSEEKENQPVELEQADGNFESDEERDLDVGEEENSIQKVYSNIFQYKEFFINYVDMKEAFVKRVYIKNPNGCVKNIEAEINILAGQIIQCNYDLLMLIGTAPEEIREFFRNRHCGRIKERVEDSVFRNYVTTKDFVVNEEEDSRELYRIMAEKRRSNIYEELLDELPVEDMTNMTHDTTPVMIEEVFTKEKSRNESFKTERHTFKHAKEFREGLHLFVLVHGFQATHIDMQEIKNHIAMVVPNSVFLCSCSNEGKKTNDDIEGMGENLSEEIYDFFDDDEDVGDHVTKISFIGHSMGGIIIRCALPSLSRFKKMMHGFCTLSSPHLGYASCKSKLVKVGLWAMQAFNKPKSIKQLSMGDSSHIKDTFMYKVSEFKGMKWFKHIMLFSSIQDGYVTFDSARIQIFKNTSLYDNASKADHYVEMAGNILNGTYISV